MMHIYKVFPISLVLFYVFFSFSAMGDTQRKNPSLSKEGFFNGYKGYHYHVLHYKKYKDGWWYPPKAFEGPAPVYPWAPSYLGQSALDKHIAYCQTKFRSYNKQTNRYLAYSGQYRPCISPYYGAAPAHP